MRLDRAGEALDHYEAALRIKPDDAEALNNMGVILRMRGDNQKAALMFERALANDPTLKEARDNLARLREGGDETSGENQDQSP